MGTEGLIRICFLTFYLFLLLLWTLQYFLDISSLFFLAVINPCEEQTDNCTTNAMCTFLGSSYNYTCDCNDGFMGDGFISCSGMTLKFALILWLPGHIYEMCLEMASLEGPESGLSSRLVFMELDSVLGRLGLWLPARWIRTGFGLVFLVYCFGKHFLK